MLTCFRYVICSVVTAIAWSLLLSEWPGCQADEAVNIGTRRELFVDDTLIKNSTTLIEKCTTRCHKTLRLSMVNHGKDRPAVTTLSFRTVSFTGCTIVAVQSR